MGPTLNKRDVATKKRFMNSKAMKSKEALSTVKCHITISVY